MQLEIDGAGLPRNNRLLIGVDGSVDRLRTEHRALVSRGAGAYTTGFPDPAGRSSSTTLRPPDEPSSWG